MVVMAENRPFITAVCGCVFSSELKAGCLERMFKGRLKMKMTQVVAATDFTEV